MIISREITEDVLEKAKIEFPRKVDVRGDDECWPWLGHIRGTGYGTMGYRGHNYVASRLAIVLDGRELRVDQFACHRCDNPRCVNPRHLFVGSPADNLLDCKSKNRFRNQRGEEHRNARLTEDEVRFIRSSGFGVTALARQFGLSKSTIYGAKVGRTWRHVS